MFSIKNIFNLTVFKILTIVFSTVLAFSSLQVGINKYLPPVPEDFVPVVRFAVLSDIHISSENETDLNAIHFDNFFKDLYDYSDKSDYKKIDAILVAGDMTARGQDEQYRMFNKILNENIKDETNVICVLGNHEFIAYRDDDPKVGYEKYKEYINNEVDRHEIINGYHFIGVSYSDDAKTFKTKKQWLKNELDKACNDTPDKPVFVFNHPHPFATVYGSVNWCDITLKNVLSKYPQVIDFSGHSHYAANDPRSIWQGSFTAVGSGCLAGQQTNLDYLTGGQDVPGETGTFWIVEADAEGNVNLKLYDVVSHELFEDINYYLPNTTYIRNHYYTWNNLKSLDTCPEFPDNSSVNAEINNDNSVSIHFPDASGYFACESYKINITKGLSSVWSGSVDSNYTSANRNGVSVNVGNIGEGTFEVSVMPVSPYAKTGNILSGTIIIK